MISGCYVKDPSSLRSSGHGAGAFAPAPNYNAAYGVSVQTQPTGYSYINCGATNNSLQTANGDRTIAAWVKPSTLSAGNMTIAGWGNDSGGLLSEIMILGTTGRIQFHGNGADITSTTSIVINTWSYVVYTLTGGTVRFYINGSLDATTGSVTLNTSTVNCKIGRQPDFNGQYFRGLIEQVGIWSRALSQSEVTTLYSSGTGLSY